ncbi:MAG: hypothetical protein ACRD1R_14235 [Acidobacteriota bacterium]
MPIDTCARGVWGSKPAFVPAAAGSAIGWGNIWRFPTQTGLNGGAAFVLVYVACVLLIGLPVMLAELTLGRRAKSDPVGTFKSLAPASGIDFYLRPDFSKINYDVILAALGQAFFSLSLA